MNKRHACAYTCLFFCTLFLFSCSKKDSPNNSGGSGSIGTGVSSASGIWLNNFITAQAKDDTTYTELTLTSSHTISKVVSVTRQLGVDTTYTTLLTVYSGGKLTQLLSASDSNATTGTLYTQFDYSIGGQLQRIAYTPGTPTYTYDSLVLSKNNMVQEVYHFIPVGTAGTMTNVQTETFTWSTQGDIISVLFNNLDTIAGTWTASTVTYQFDGSFNPYQTVQDLPLILGGINTVNYLSANNVTGVTLVGQTIGVNYQYTYNSKSLPTFSNEAVIIQTQLKNNVLTYFQYIE